MSLGMERAYRLVKEILKKEGYNRINLDETLGWDFVAYKNGRKQKIEVKETKGGDYFRRSSFSKDKEQAELFEEGKLKIFFIYYNKNGEISYKFFDKYSRGRYAKLVKRIN